MSSVVVPAVPCAPFGRVQHPTPGIAPTYLPALDGLRALAVGAVLLLHAGVGRWGGAGVDVFFVLSGFLITRILLDARSAASWGSYAAPFYWRRALRIFPLAAVGLVVAFVLVPLAHAVAPAAIRGWLWEPVPLREQVWWWAYLSNWYTSPRTLGAWIVTHYWSLAVEEQFYLVWPWIVWRLPPRALARWCMALLVAAPLARAAVSWAVAMGRLAPPVGSTYDYLTPLRMDGLLAGALVALALAGPLADAPRARRWAWRLVGTGAALVAICTVDLRPVGWGWALRGSGLALTGAGVVLGLVAAGRTVWTQALAHPLPVWIGRRSYALYVVHAPVAMELRRHGHAGWRAALVTAALSGALAWASWRWLEAPMLRRKARHPMARHGMSSM